MKNVIIFSVAIILAAAAGFGVQRYLATDAITDADAINPVIGKIRPEFAMLDLDGNIRNIQDWEGQVVLLNFWATWCPPCLEEIQDFIEMQEALDNKGLQIVGVAVDNEDDVRQFASDLGMNYPVMAGETEAIELSQRYGNSIGGLPFSAIIDQNGKVTHTITGILSKDRLISILRELGLET
ncbi:MAG: TlpA family protein disulfide reductase [Gammaproteobacteria bacterium]|nr:TlpA family protein disulfide reductase [Gammaproteobacteria bacterium]